MMDPERWRRIEELYQSAVDADVADRATLLAHADPEIGREVESLLAQPTAGTPLDRSAFSALDRLQVETGALIGPYRIEGLLGGMWLPLRGRLQLGAGGTEGVLLPGEVRITEAEAGAAVGRGNAVWIALLGTRAAWRKALQGSTQMPLTEPLLLPTWHVASRTLRRRAIALARAAARGCAEPALQAVVESLFDLQEAHALAIERCPGRTHQP